MEAQFHNNHLLHFPDNYYGSHLSAIDLASFPLVQDFIVRLNETELFGFQIYFHSDSLGRLAAFPWWDNVEKDLPNYTSKNIPVGSLQVPFEDLEQGWQILIFEYKNYVYVLQGGEPCCTEFSVWFKVARIRYIEEWLRVIRQFNPAA